MYIYIYILLQEEVRDAVMQCGFKYAMRWAGDPNEETAWAERYSGGNE